MILILVSVALLTQQISRPGFGSRAKSPTNDPYSFYNQASTQVALGGSGFSTPPTVTTNAALNNTRKSLPYTASPAPGPNCDTAGASWDSAFSGTCLATGYVLSFGSTINFDWYPGLAFPENQKIDVTIKFNTSSGAPTDYSGFGGACFELFMRASHASGARYDFGVCPDGSWSTSSPAGKITSGKATQASSYAVSASCVGTSLTLALNGVIAGQASDSNVVAGGEYISLYSNGGSDSVLLSNFTFTPLN